MRGDHRLMRGDHRLMMGDRMAQESSQLYRCTFCQKLFTSAQREWESCPKVRSRRFYLGNTSRRCISAIVPRRRFSSTSMGTRSQSTCPTAHGTWTNGSRRSDARARRRASCSGRCGGSPTSSHARRAACRCDHSNRITAEIHAHVRRGAPPPRSSRSPSWITARTTRKSPSSRRAITTARTHAAARRAFPPPLSARAEPPFRTGSEDVVLTGRPPIRPPRWAQARLHGAAPHA